MIRVQVEHAWPLRPSCHLFHTLITGEEVSMRCVFLAVLLAGGAWAQFELGSIVGVVSDPSKAPVAGAMVEIRSLSTNVKREVPTSATGEYNSLPLAPGRYAVTVRQQGFREQTTELTLAVGQRLQADFALEIGAVTEQVSVTASTGLIETASSEVGQVRLAKQIVDLPLNTRNFTQLVQLAPGVLTGVGGARSYSAADPRRLR